MIDQEIYSYTNLIGNTMTTDSIEIRKLEPEKKTGLTVIITGNGKGKTTSAMGIALRACGHNLKTVIIQFMKGDLFTGEWESVKRLAPLVTLYHTGKGFCGIEGNPFPHSEHRKNAQDAISLVMDSITSGQFDVMILDEINNALELKLVDLSQVHAVLDAKPAAMHLVMTGRDAHEEIIERADTVSEVQEIKHAYRKGIEPQPGVDY